MPPSPQKGATIGATRLSGRARRKHNRNGFGGGLTRCQESSLGSKLGPSSRNIGVSLCSSPKARSATQGACLLLRLKLVWRLFAGLGAVCDNLGGP